MTQATLTPKRPPAGATHPASMRQSDPHHDPQVDAIPRPGDPCTPEAMLELPDPTAFELVDGRLVEIPMSAKSDWVGSVLSYKLMGHVLDPSRQLGVVLKAETTYRCFADAPDKIRRPDVSFIQRGRVTADMLEGHVPIAPDMAAEVISQHDKYEAVRGKVEDYLRAGVRLVWVVEPSTHAVLVYRPDGGISKIAQSDTLTGEGVIEGFSCPVADLFVSVPGLA